MGIFQGGYAGKLLYVDLTDESVQAKPLERDFALKYIGGRGFSARILYEELRAGIDPLSPDNIIVFAAGPLSGTPIPSASRLIVAAKSPMTGGAGDASSGGYWAPEMKYAGFDAIIVKGRSPKPVYLWVENGKAELRPAEHLWGKRIHATSEALKAEIGDEDIHICAIGPGGENLVRYASIVTDEEGVGARTGMGAVMGSKNLKAVGVRGSANIPLADPDGFKTVVREIIAGLDEDMQAMSFQLAGTASGVDMLLMYGDMPIRYYQQGEWEGASNLSGVLMTDQYLNKGTACYRCPIACGRETRAPNYGLDKVDGPEYETLGAFGSLAMVDDLEAVIYAGHLCNVYGVDTISTGCTIALACEMFERGIISAADTDGLEIRYGDVQMTHRLIEMIAHRDGFGVVLAEGSAALAERFGVPELAVTVNRLEVPMHDPRAFVGLAVTYALSPRGACHMEGDVYGVDMGMGPALELGILPGDRFDATEEKGRIAARQQAWRNLYNAMILCQFQNPGVERVLAALNGATGWGLEADDLMTLGKRIVTLKRMLNMRRGLTRADDRLPDLLMQPLEGGTEGTVPDVDVLLAGAYAEYGWDPETGKPTRETLGMLGLGFAAKAL